MGDISAQLRTTQPTNDRPASAAKRIAVATLELGRRDRFFLRFARALPTLMLMQDPGDEHASNKDVREKADRLRVRVEGL